MTEMRRLQRNMDSWHGFMAWKGWGQRDGILVGAIKIRRTMAERVVRCEAQHSTGERRNACSRSGGHGRKCRGAGRGTRQKKTVGGSAASREEG